ncbi:hypothetical protein MVEN_01081200 [Mycena venus]|uniref:Uncharacterized protein n=1 Tax=Mycena venus TaxID=2733690 RepID=A0A8H6Y633_9AGAR|nr:hypothetical protein MVEN_01081200 [Mycena venus]
MLPAILPVQELWDHIVDQLSQSQEDSRSCSLVCRALVARAQSHAFSYIHIESRVHGNRFARLLESSPHLIPYIRHLHFKNCGGLSITPLDLIPWSNLDTLTLHRHSFSNIPFYRHVLEELYTLVALPSIRRLNFCGRLWHRTELFSIFARCTTALDDIDFGDCSLRSLSASVPADLPAPHIYKPKVRRLALDRSVVGEAIRDPACPLDVSSLTYVQSYSSTMPPSHWALILRSRTTIETLDFSRIETDEYWGDSVSVDLSLFPSLRCIMLGKFFASDPWIPVHPHAEILLRLPLDNRVMTICFKLFGRLWTFGSEEPARKEVEGVARDLHAIETVLTRPEMSALARVEIDVDSTNIADLVRRSMPTLHARGIISIYCV